MQVAPIVDDVAPKATRTKVSQRWASARAAVAQHGQHIIQKLPVRLAPWGPRAAPGGAGEQTVSDSLGKHAPDATEDACLAAAHDGHGGTERDGPGETAKPQSNATMDKVSAQAATGLGHGSYCGERPSVPTAEDRAAEGVATGVDMWLTGNSSRAGGQAPAWKSSGGWRGAGGLAQHASRGGALEASGPQKELDKIAELTAPWEILVLTPKLLRHAVNVLGAELAAVLEAAAAHAAEGAAASTMGWDEDQGWEVQAAVKHGADVDNGQSGLPGGSCPCRWERQWSELDDGTDGKAAICWCGLVRVVHEVYGGGP